VQQELLAARKNADVRVYAVWFSMYPTDQRDRWPADVLTDPRATHFWDEQKAVGTWYMDHFDEIESRLAPNPTGLGGPILWDAYLVYGPESKWDETPTGLRRWGRTILDTKDSLREALDAVSSSAAR